MNDGEGGEERRITRLETLATEAISHLYLPIMATSLQRPLSSVLEEVAVGEGSTVTSKFLVYRF